MESRIVYKGQREIWRHETILHVDYSAGYLNAFVCQNLTEPYTKKNVLYKNYTLITIWKVFPIEVLEVV